MTNAELAILSLLVEQPSHGYEIEQVIEKRGMRDWTEIGFSSIYYLLKKLEQKALIEAQMEHPAGPGPARKVYHATPSGRKALQEAVLEALSVPRPSYSPLLLGLANLPAISQTETLAALRQYRDKLASQLVYVQSRWESQRPLPYFVEAMFDHSVAMIQAEQVWVEKFIAQLEVQAGEIH